MNNYYAKIGFVASSFDLLHAGHCLMLKDAKDQCEWLVAALHSDPSSERPNKNKPLQSLQERLIQLESIKYVDQIEIYETEQDLKLLLKKIKPDVRILGSDWKGKKFTGKDLCNETYFHERDHDFSSSELRIRIEKSQI